MLSIVKMLQMTSFQEKKNVKDSHKTNWILTSKIQNTKYRWQTEAAELDETLQ